MEFRVLGPLEIVADGRALPVTARSQQQALLAVLLLRANHVVATWWLIDELWGETLPAKPELALRMAVSRLRRLLAEGDPAARSARLMTRPGGYVLEVARDLVDAHRFERMVAEGRSALAAGAAERAAELLRGALELWRGPALASVPAGGLVTAEAARLEAARISALQTRIEADLANGRHLEVLPELEALVASQPLQEGVHAQLMVALYRAGRQADALGTYRALRERLVDELGIEPGPALQQLERRILTADPALAAPAPRKVRRVSAATAAVPPRQLPHASATFTGRQRELAELAGVVAGDGRASSMVIAAIHGSGGIGKSALAIRVAHQLAEQYPDGQLYMNLQGATPGLAPLSPLDVLGRMLRALGLDPGKIPSEVQEAAARFRSLAAGRRLLVVLDNAASAQQVAPLLPASPTCGVLVTSRRMLALEGAHVLHLDGLPEEEAVELLGRIAGPSRIAADPVAAAKVVGFCGRLPLALQIAGARLAARPGWPVGVLAERLAGASGRLDELELAEVGVRASFEVSLRALGDSTDEWDRAAAAAFGLLSLPDGPQFDAAAAARLLDQPEPVVGGLLERLVDAQLLETPRPGRYQFHDLVRLYAREHAARQHPASRRLAALTRLFGFYTATAWRTLALLRPGERCLTTADPRWTDSLEFAGELEALDWLEATRPSLLAAINQVAAMAPTLPAELAIQLASALFGLFLTRSYWGDGVEANQTALRLARRIRDRAAEAHAHNDLGSMFWRLERYEQATASLQRSLATYQELDDRHGQATSLGNLGLVHWRLGHYDQALDCQQRSLATYRELGDRRGQATSLGNLGMVDDRLGRYQEALSCQRKSLATYRELGDRRGQATSVGNLGRVYWRLRRHEEALPCLRESLRIYQELGDRWGQAASLNDLGSVYWRLGRYDDALDCQRESLAVYREVGDRYGQAEALRDLGDVLRALGRRERAQKAWWESLAIFEELRVPEADEIRTRLAALPAERASGPWRTRQPHVNGHAAPILRVS
jgi:DNA-binding SARP family transcriptional activator